MRIVQARVSNSIKAFKKSYLHKYDLKEGCDINKPIVLFGVYDPSDFRYYLSQKSDMIVVWCGSDALMLNSAKARMIKEKSATHIVKSKFMSDDLTRYGIPHKIVPVTWQVPDLNPVPRGNSIFHYGNGKNGFYGEGYLPEIKRRTGLNIIKTTVTTYTKFELESVYADCFIGLRLTLHDGIPNTVIEMGMMGRRCIYNGNTPNAIPWNNIEDICKSILREVVNKDKDDTKEVSDEVKKFIDIGDGWLHV